MFGAFAGAVDEHVCGGPPGVWVFLKLVDGGGHAFGVEHVVGVEFEQVFGLDRRECGVAGYGGAAAEFAGG